MFKLLLIFSVVLLLAPTSKLMAEEVTCQSTLAKLTEFNDSYSDNPASAIELTDGLFTTALLESPLFTNDVFKTNANFINYRTRETRPDLDGDQNKIDALKKELKQAKETISFWKHEGRPGALERAKQNFKDTKSKLSWARYQLKEDKALSKEIIKRPDASFADLPTPMKFKLSSKVWDSLVSTYALPTDPNQMTLEQTKAKSNIAKTWGHTYAEFVALNKITSEIDQNPILKREAIEFISRIFSAAQFDEGLYKNPVKLKSKLPEKPTQAESLSATLDAFDKVSKESSHDSLRELVMIQYPIISSPTYFLVFAKTVEKLGFKPKEFLSGLPSYSVPMKRQLSNEVWSDLKAHYMTSLADSASPTVAVKLQAAAKADGFGADTFLNHAYLIRAIDDNAKMKDDVLALIESEFVKSAELMPHFQNAEKWKNSKVGDTIAFAAVPLSSYVGLLGGAFLFSHLGMGHTWPAAIGELGVSTIGMGALPAVATKGYQKVRGFFANRKLKKALANVKTQAHATHDSEE